ncbi:MAG: hypothetical protein H8D97_00970 [Proteobacteria bacterium]|nr:hypothetical protein [Pseudomonadota bacterium]
MAELGIEQYEGIVLPDIDLMNRGRYKVHINELHTHIGVTSGIWCRNRTSPNSYNSDFPGGSYGSYFPLLPQTRVIVQFVSGDYHQGEIVRIIADQENGIRLPFMCIPEARDQIFTVFRTPIYSNFLHINEVTAVQPMNSMHFYFNADLLTGDTWCGDRDPITAPSTNIRTKYIIDENGVHFCTADSVSVSINTDGNIAINRNILVKIGKNADIHIEGAAKVHIDGQTDLYVDGDINVKSDSTINIQGGPLINLNCGTSATKATDSNGYASFPIESKEMKGISRISDVASAAAKTPT